MTETSWILRVSESKTNYWLTYAVDASILSFFVWWDFTHFGLTVLTSVVLFIAGIASWTPTEYAFHRWVYHLGMEIARRGHEKHHDDPKGYLAMPFFVTPLLFIPPQQLMANYYGVRGVSTFFAGFFGGYIAYGLFHHALHHYRLPFAWYRHLQSQHRIHHAFPETNYGVTMRVWDRVFGTEFRKGSAQ